MKLTQDTVKSALSSACLSAEPHSPCRLKCANQDKYYKKLNEKFIAEQKKANSPEKKWNEYIDAWADEYNQAQKETKEYYVTRTSK